MTYFLGFDVAKAKLDYALVNEQGIEQIYGKVANNETDIATLLLTIAGNYPNDSLQCTVESTSTYHLVLAETSFALVSRLSNTSAFTLMFPQPWLLQSV